MIGRIRVRWRVTHFAYQSPHKEVQGYVCVGGCMCVAVKLSILSQKWTVFFTEEQIGYCSHCEWAAFLEDDSVSNIGETKRQSLGGGVVGRSIKNKRN